VSILSLSNKNAFPFSIFTDIEKPHMHTQKLTVLSGLCSDGITFIYGQYSIMSSCDIHADQCTTNRFVKPIL
jgi:hypothetical protein